MKYQTNCDDERVYTDENNDLYLFYERRIVNRHFALSIKINVVSTLCGTLQLLR